MPGPGASASGVIDLLVKFRATRLRAPEIKQHAEALGWGG
jgi:hypothetical protein